MLYDIGFAIFSLFYLPTLIFKGKLHGDFLERFGRYDNAKRSALANAKGAIWIQAVSVGEVALCRDFVPALKTKFPGRTIIFSTITKAGNDMAKRLFQKDAIIIYFPLDFSFIVKKAIKLARPKVYVMVETEIWPNFLKEIERNAIAAILINGRISDRSIGKYRLAKPFLRKILRNMNILCMQSRIDADRIIGLGARPDRVKVTGNMKFDIHIKASRLSVAEIMGQLGLKEGDELLVAGSTHPGEEEEIIGAYKELTQKFPRLKLLIAPRHIERSDEVAAIVKKLGFEPILLSILSVPCTLRPACPAGGSVGGEPCVYILDTIGRLNDFYSIASVVFIGGSLIKHGGQNPIEPAVYGKPVIFGRYMFNFKNAAEAFLAKGAAIRVDSGSELIPILHNLLADKSKRSEMGAMAERVVVENGGATDRNLDCFSAFGLLAMTGK